MKTRGVAPFLILMALLLSGDAFAKCSLLTIKIKGNTKFAHSESMQVEIYSDPNPGWENHRLEVLNGVFDGDFLFDTLSSFSPKDESEECQRRPVSIDVTLVENNKSVGTVRLWFPRDFKKSADNEYIVVHDLVFSSR